MDTDRVIIRGTSLDFVNINDCFLFQFEARDKCGTAESKSSLTYKI